MFLDWFWLVKADLRTVFGGQVGVISGNGWGRVVCKAESLVYVFRFGTSRRSDELSGGIYVESVAELVKVSFSDGASTSKVGYEGF